MKNGRKGFTVFEVLIVTGAIAIFVAGALLTFVIFEKKARDAKTGAEYTHTIVVGIVNPAYGEVLGPGDNVCETTECTPTTNKPTVTLTARPKVGGAFQFWGNACSGSDPTCPLVLPSGTSTITYVTATFIPVYTLIVVPDSSQGTGGIASNPFGINCGSPCNATSTADFPAGSTITLTGKPDFGIASFTGCDTTGGPGTNKWCGLAMTTTSRLVTATFIDRYDLTVLIDGPGSVTVKPPATGIDCPNDCDESFYAGHPITLTVDPNPPYPCIAVSNLTGCDETTGPGGTGNWECKVEMATTTSVTATFSAC